MAQLNRIAGLFQVASDVWQVRAMDYANMSVIRGDTGWILVDPPDKRKPQRLRWRWLMRFWVSGR